MHGTKKTPKISLIIPLFNEEKRMYNLNILWDYIKNKKYITELIVINDGSTDKTNQLLAAFHKRTKCRMISYRKNKGKGYAIKKGILSAKGNHIVFMDVDLSTPPKMIGELKKIIHRSDIIVGTRKNDKAILLQRQSIVREGMGKLFTLISQTIMGVNISDFTCGFKCYKKTAAKKIFSKQRIDRWAFDAESLFLAHKYGFSISEFPVEWRDVRGTKVRFPQDAIQSFFDLIQIRINDIFEKY
jgi:dolichyl-phosphate beta-glucosyltransferase